MHYVPYIVLEKKNIEATLCIRSKFTLYIYIIKQEKKIYTNSVQIGNTKEENIVLMFIITSSKIYKN